MAEVSGLLASTCPVARYINHVIHWRIQFSTMLSFFSQWGSFCHFLSPLLSLGIVFVVVSFFLHWCFSSGTGACSFPFVWGLMAAGCAVAPVMGALFQSRGRLPTVEARGYSRRPTSILMMQLFTQHIKNFYFHSHRWSHKGHKVSLLRTKTHPMQQEKGKSLAIIIIDFKVNFV